VSAGDRDRGGACWRLEQGIPFPWRCAAPPRRAAPVSLPKSPPETSPSRKCLVATQDTAELIRYALRGIEQLFREGYGYKKAGIILTALVPAQQVQAHLFDRQGRERSTKLIAAIDVSNRQWGTGTVRYAAMGLSPDWKMRCTRCSPRYTTRWEELVVVRCEV
jgi:hypothetical protein